jgi:hypothetical protein
MKQGRRRAGVRDQDPSSFFGILESLLRAAPGILGAALVDGEGETVDYAGELPPFQIKVAAAHLRLILDEVVRGGGIAFGTPQEIAIRAEKGTFVIRSLPDGYALVIVLARRALVLSARAVDRIERDLSAEAGWALSPRKPNWYPVEVEPAARDRRRPARIRAGAAWESVVVIGTVVGLARDRGYRVVLRSGAEVTLIREPHGAWYADEPVLEVEPLPNPGSGKRPGPFSRTPR